MPRFWTNPPIVWKTLINRTLKRAGWVLLAFMVGSGCMSENLQYRKADVLGFDLEAGYTEAYKGIKPVLIYCSELNFLVPKQGNLNTLKIKDHCFGSLFQKKKLTTEIGPDKKHLTEVELKQNCLRRLSGNESFILKTGPKSGLWWLGETHDRWATGKAAEILQKNSPAFKKFIGIPIGDCLEV